MCSTNYLTEENFVQTTITCEVLEGNPRHLSGTKQHIFQAVRLSKPQPEPPLYVGWRSLAEVLDAGGGRDRFTLNEIEYELWCF